MQEHQPKSNSDSSDDVSELAPKSVDHLKRPTQADMVAVSEKTNRRVGDSIGAAAIGASLAL